MAEQQQQKRQRLPKFSSEELEVLMAQVNTHRNQLFSRAHRLSQGDRDRIWQDIADKVNAVSRVKRTVKAIKTRWDDLMRRTNEVAHLARHSGQPGVGPSAAEHLTLEEWRVHRVMFPQSIVCMSGSDTADFPYWRAIKEETGSSTEAPGPSGTQSDCQEDRPSSWTPVSEAPTSPALLPSIPETFLSSQPRTKLMNEFDRQLLESQNQQTGLLRDFWEGFQPLMQELIQATRELAHETHLVAEHTRQVAQQMQGTAQSTRELVIQNQQLVLHTQEMAQNISDIRLTLQQQLCHKFLEPLKLAGSKLEQRQPATSLQGLSTTHLSPVIGSELSQVEHSGTAGLAQAKRNSRTPEKKRKLD
uniref:Uncharacterized LOC103181135 n=1 Tax=Callorhinchus milii TaxID=7868 RepID=A0A4W3KAU9_CALMI|eukprot:gi/632959350/ref/XP_007895571.1/ PREDICTED: uncharacterized protein LOC103181135 [Callorhinchus milii]